MSTNAEDFASSPHHRLVATFPLSGRRNDAYTVWIHQEGTHSERYAVCDHYGFNFAAPARFDEALNLCLRNCGWGVRAHPATEKELSY